MQYTTNKENLYPEGSVVSARVAPHVKLRIARYYQRIYYCTILGGDENARPLVYFERELLPPL